MSIVINSFIRK